VLVLNSWPRSIIGCKKSANKHVVHGITCDLL
jgi:hypothetical protein